jgi:hypothetical protein
MRTLLILTASALFITGAAGCTYEHHDHGYRSHAADYCRPERVDVRYDYYRGGPRYYGGGYAHHYYRDPYCR